MRLDTLKRTLPGLAVLLLPVLGMSLLLGWGWRMVGPRDEGPRLYVSIDSIDGLEVGDVVRVKGTEAGVIERLGVPDFASNEGTTRFLVVVRLSQPLRKLWLSYRIDIEKSNVTGGRFLSIIPRDPENLDPERQVPMAEDAGMTPEKALVGCSVLPIDARPADWLLWGNHTGLDWFHLPDAAKFPGLGRGRKLTDEGK